HAVEALKHCPEKRQTLEQAIDIRLELRNSLQPVGEQAKLLERMREAEALAESLNDQGRLGQVSAYLSGYFVQAGDDAFQAIEMGQRALAIASAIDDFGLRIQANHFLGSAYYRRGEYDQAIEHFRGNVDALVGVQIYERFGLVFLASVGSRYQLVLLFSDRGEFTEAAIHANEVVRIAEVVNHPYNLYTAYFAVGCMHLRKGAIDKAIAALERSLELCRSWDIQQNAARVAAVLGSAYAATGRVGEALPVLDLAKNRVRLSFLRGQLAQGYLLIGKLEEAATLAVRALDFSRRHAERGNEARALYVLGEIASYDDSLDVNKAVAHYQQAMALAEELRMRPLIAHCHVGLGKLYRRGKKIKQAEEKINKGVAINGGREKSLWVERGEAGVERMGVKKKNQWDSAWGTRGSLAKPGPSTVRYGGNTSCVEVRAADGTLIILDCGTGAHDMGRSLVASGEHPIRGHLLLTHTHWDHIQGFPFFSPLFIPGNEFDVYAAQGLGQRLEDTLAGQMEYTYFPVTLGQLGATIRYHDLTEGTFDLGAVQVTARYLNHPGIALGYRLEAGGVAVVYATDHEPHSRHQRDVSGPAQVLPVHREDQRHVEFLAGADL